MSRKTWWSTAASLLWLAIALSVAYYMVRDARQKAQVSVSRAKLKQFGLALHSYHDKYDCFPPAYVLGPDGKPWHSWRVLLLPFLDEQKLYDRYRFDEPWDGPHNRELQALRPEAYASLLQQSRLNTVTTYLGVVSRRTMWPAHLSVKLSDVTDGPSNTIQLLQNVGSDVVWSEPREMREKDALARLSQIQSTHQPASDADQILVMLADGAVRAVNSTLKRDLFVSLLTPRFRESFVVDDWPDDVDSASRLPDIVDASQYPNTLLLAVSDTPVVVDQTLVYCATVQLAWDLLRPGGDQPVDVTNGTPVSDALNAHPFPAQALEKQDYFAGASGLAPDQSGKLFEEFRERFPNAPVEMLNSPAGLPGVRILAYLQKSLPFHDVMQRFSKPFPFMHGDQVTNVNSFGWPSSSEQGGHQPALANTVEVSDYTGTKDFIVLLKSDSRRQDEIILARIKPAATLRATWDAVATRLKQPISDQVVRELRGMDELQIPIISFGVSSPVSEVVGLSIPTATNPDRFIADARQTMRFRLDEYGAELIADTHLIVGEFGEDDPPLDPLAPRQLTFDAPFLLVLKEKSASEPYFLAWVGNTDLMEPAK